MRFRVAKIPLSVIARLLGECVRELDETDSVHLVETNLNFASGFTRRSKYAYLAGGTR
jgi:hypothetical protein